MEPKTVYAIGLISVIIAGVGMFLPWYSVPLVPQSTWPPYLSLMFITAIFNMSLGGLIGHAVYALIILGENLGLAGCLNLERRKGYSVPIMFLVGGMSTIFSSIVFVVALLSSSLPFTGQEGSVSVGFWMEIIAGFIMLVAAILALRLSPKKSAEPTGSLPPPPPPSTS